ncbi:MAG: (Fe-S)-binding protein [Alphaproteobacteria bacterium]|nr:(Fe-S)-binding protein [Alphaproteobacteria bacterium]
MSESAKPRVGLFVTCLVDLYRPSIGFAAVKLMEAAGCVVEFPPDQTCCGQPAYNAGDTGTAKDLARAVIRQFEKFDYLVAPSGSCAGMIRVHYPALLADEPEWSRRARALAAKTHELTSFLVDVLKLETVSARCQGKATYHDSCAGLRELGVKGQPRRLLAGVEGLELKELPGAETCCGFGGTFSVKYGAISADLADAKAKDIMATGADTVLAGDLGCLLNIAGRLSRLGATIKVRHVAEVLAGEGDQPAIGEAVPTDKT